MRDVVLEEAAKECEAQRFGFYATQDEVQEQIAEALRAMKGAKP